MNFDSTQFKKLERAGYNRIGARYQAASAARQSIADSLLAAAKLEPGLRVLDLASGPGLLAREARKTLGGDGLVVASDISEGQLACCPDLIRVAADGEALPLATSGFDRVLCGLGLMFFPDEQKALREIHRVLKPGGRLALSVWGRAEEVPLVETALACIRRVLPPPKVQRPSIFRFGDADELERRLASAEFSGIDIRPFRFAVNFKDAAAYWQGFLDLAGGAAESLSRLPAAKQQELADSVGDELAPHVHANGYRLTSTILVATASPV